MDLSRAMPGVGSYEVLREMFRCFGMLLMMGL